LKENFIIDFLIKHAIFSIILNFLFLLGFGFISKRCLLPLGFFCFLCRFILYLYLIF
jgi:hypothetical protein